MSKTASERLQEQSIVALFQVTDFVAGHTKVVMAGGHSHEILATLHKLREQVQELETLD